MTRYVALLRGINVGGNNIIKMADLKKCFEGCGYADVATYIQSGNVIFEAAGKAAEVADQVEATLEKTFSYHGRIALRSQKEMTSVVDDAPKGFGDEPDKYRYDVIFLRPGLKPADALKQIKTREGVDQAWAGDGVLYFSRLIEKVTQSQINKIVGTPVYKEMTIRNWNTTLKLRDLIVQG